MVNSTEMDKSNLSQTDIEKYYDFLNHKKETEIRIIKKTKSDSYFVHNKKEFFEVCKKFNGKYNIYAGVNERKKDGKKDDDVVQVTHFYMDIDPERPKNTSSSDEQKQDALILAREIIDYIKTSKTKNVSLIDSGNGYHIYIKTTPVKVTDKNKDIVKYDFKEFGDHIKNHFTDTHGCVIDTIFNLSRVMKVPGTLSVKGEKRLSKIIELDDTITPLFKNLSNEKYIKRKKEKITTEDISAGEMPIQSIDFVLLCSKDQKLNDLYNGDWEKYKGDKKKWSRSEAEAALVAKLVYYKMPKKQIYEVMDSCKIGKWKTRKTAYKDKMYNKVVKWVAEKNSKDGRIDLLKEYNVITLGINGGIKVNCPRLAKLLMKEPLNNGEKYHWITILDDSMNNKKEIFYYDNGYYKSGGEGKIKSLVNIYLDHLTRINHKREVISFIEDSKAIPRHKLEPPVNLICFKNGIYNIKTKQLEKHDPKHYFVNQIPIEYHPEAECPKIKKFFREVLQKDYVDVLQEMFGYCFYRKYLWHVIFILHGTGRNGKGITVSLLMRLLGRGNYSTRKLHDLMTDKFAKADLFGVMANVGGEISGAQIKNSVEMKHLSGGEFICGEKKFMGTFSFENYAKMIFNANKVPSTVDKTDSFYQRIIDIPYMHRFLRGDAKTKTHLLEELISKKEMEGLLIWALEGLHRLLEKDRFSKEYDPDEMDERYELIANPVRIFLMRNYVFGSQQWIEKKIIIDKFKEWAKEKNIPYNVTTASFTRTLRSVIKGAKAGRKKQDDGKRYEGYWHIQEIDKENEEGVQVHDDVDDFLNEISES